MTNETKEDYYKLLDITKPSSADEIKKAYKKMALKFHPDRNPEGTEIFRKVTEAYEVLSDVGRKEVYDMYGHGTLI